MSVLDPVACLPQQSATAISESAHAEPIAARQLRVGVQYVAEGKIAEAISAYQRGLAAIGDQPGAEFDSAVTAELHFKLGNAVIQCGDLDLAATNYKSALQLAPDMVACWCNLGIVYQTQDRPQDAITLYAQALARDPAHWPTRTNLARALMATQQHAIARALLLELSAERPNDAQIHHELGKLYGALDDATQALACFERAVALNPADADAFYWIGSLHEKLGAREAAETALAMAAQIKPLIPRPAKTSPAEFRVLSLFSPFAGNTPTEYLLTGTSYDVNTLAVFVGRSYDIELLRRSADLVVNLICDADQAQSLLPLAADIVDLVGLPVLNDPRKVERTSREQIAQLLRGLPGCVVPQVTRLAGGAAGWVSMLMAGATFSTPVLA
ncbi:MAG TPA: tetratricopeptide repeat protein, partial [Burkholderiales bacterium]|nr:tetratricopeptide repeat protein [Burkholderiales bacterium]